jgi:hypothetical protein
MGNRHHHKKLRAQVRARMGRTGESYQQALAQITAERSLPRSGHSSVDLLRIEYFGVTATIATYELAGRLACVVVSSRPHHGPFPANPLVALAARGPRVVH